MNRVPVFIYKNVYEFRNPEFENSIKNIFFKLLRKEVAGFEKETGKKVRVSDILKQNVKNIDLKEVELNEKQ